MLSSSLCLQQRYHIWLFAMKVLGTLQQCGGRCDNLHNHYAESSAQAKYFMAWSFSTQWTIKSHCTVLCLPVTWLQALCQSQSLWSPWLVCVTLESFGCCHSFVYCSHGVTELDPYPRTGFKCRQYAWVSYWTLWMEPLSPVPLMSQLDLELKQNGKPLTRYLCHYCAQTITWP